MGAAKANNSKDTYLATAVTFIVIGALYLIDKLIQMCIRDRCRRFVYKD